MTVKKSATVVNLAFVALLCLHTNVSRCDAENADETIRSAQLNLERARIAHDPGAEANALYSMGCAYRTAGKQKEASQSLSTALALLHNLNDSKGEADTLTVLAEVKNDMGRSAEALKLLNKALAIEKPGADLSGQTRTLTALGEVYCSLSQSQKAVDFLSNALALERQAGIRVNEPGTLNFLGETYLDLGQPAKAFELYSDALLIENQEHDRAAEAVTLNDIGYYYWSQSQPLKALTFYRQALPVEREIGSRGYEAVTLAAIGVAYADLGDIAKALDYYRKAIPIDVAINDRTSEAIAFHASGKLYNDIGQQQIALSFYRRALGLERTLSDRKAEATTLNNIAGVYRGIGRRRKALQILTSILPIQQAIGDTRSEAITLQNIGALYQELGQPRTALLFYKRALPITREVGDRLAEASTLWRQAAVTPGAALADYLLPLEIAKEAGNLPLQGLINTSLMQFLNQRKQLETAIFFGKQAINNYQQIRGHMTGLDESLQKTFIQSKADAYRALAKLLIDDGRIPEAEIVIRMLKQEEYSEFTRGGAAVSKASEPVELTGSEQKAETITADELRWIGLKASLGHIAEGPEKEQAKSEFARLSAELRAQNEDFSSAIDNIFSSEGNERKITGETSLMQNVLHEVQHLSPDTVGIYTIVQENEVDLIVVTQNLRVMSHSIKISRQELSAKVEAFRQLLMNPCSDPRPAALELYNLLMKPIARDLQSAKAKTLVWELDGALHFLPTSALYNGESYLATSYSSVLFTMTHADALSSPVETKDLRALGMGVSQSSEDLPALPAVPAELEGIIHDPDDRNSIGPLPGKILLNASFTAEAMQSELNEGFPIVHIASHFVLEPGSDKSYLLLGGTGAGKENSRRLTYADFSNDIGYRFDGVQLLTLSACETGTSGGSRLTDGKEIDALGELAESKGAKSVLATLWPVSDASTAEFMADFYRKWMTSTATLKVQALQQAQVTMLQSNRFDTTHASCGTAATRGSRLAGESGESGAQPKLSHPYYWAPFVLIGNWQ